MLPLLSLNIRIEPSQLISLFKELKKQILFIANSDLEAKKVYEELDGYIKGKVEYLSSQDIHFYHLDAKDRSEEAKKLKKQKPYISSRRPEFYL